MGSPERRFRAEQLQPGIVRRCVRRKRKVSGLQVAEIGLYTVAGGVWLSVWFLFGKEIWRVVG